MSNQYKLEFGFGAGEDRQGIPLDQANVGLVVNEIVETASRLFGGCFLTRGRGGWINPAGILVTEPGYVLTVYTNFSHTRDDAMKLIATIKRLLNQEAVIFSHQPVSWEYL